MARGVGQNLEGFPELFQSNPGLAKNRAKDGATEVTGVHWDGHEQIPTLKL